MPSIDPLSAQALAAQNTYPAAVADRLRQLFGGNGLGMLGTGAAGQAATALSNLGYQRHVQEAQALGQQPMSPEQWMQQQTKSRGLLD